MSDDFHNIGHLQTLLIENMKCLSLWKSILVVITELRIKSLKTLADCNDFKAEVDDQACYFKFACKSIDVNSYKPHILSNMPLRSKSFVW